MRWSWRVGSVAGIGVYIHATFLLLIVWLGFVHWAEGDVLAGALSGVSFILALFACVLLHELGHALTAKRFGILTRDITLLPIGGVSRLERMPDDPRQELWVAIAGPAVNVAIAAVLFVWLQATAQWQAPQQISWSTGPFLERLMGVNVMLVAFNMLPAFPMDGGRVLRALLATRIEYTRATQVAASIGQGMALLFGLVGLLGNPFLVFIALFVWIGAEQEASLVKIRLALGGIPVSRAMLTDFRSLAPGDTLRKAVDLILSGSQEDFPVLDEGRVVGILTRADLLAALAQRDQGVRVEDVMRRDFQIAEYTEMLETVFTRLQASPCRTLPVLSRGRLIGLMTVDNVGEFVMIQSALGARGAARAQAVSGTG
jgi:Zn-dependent protease/CBS domain-containing protein